MKQAVIYFVAIVGVVFLGLVRSRWNSRRHKDSRIVPFPEKHPPVDLTPKLSDLPQHRPAPAPADMAPRQQPQPLRSSPNREKDDLKQITGIGPKLERLLHANGIFNFGQIAEWQDADVQAMNKLLPAFHGRIRRDDWVGQARKLRDAKVAASTTRST